MTDAPVRTPPRSATPPGVRGVTRPGTATVNGALGHGYSPISALLEAA